MKRFLTILMVVAFVLCRCSLTQRLRRAGSADHRLHADGRHAGRSLDAGAHQRRGSGGGGARHQRSSSSIRAGIRRTMIDQFKQAVAAQPDGIVIMGHPGEDAFWPLVDDAESQGIIVTSGNNPLPNIEAKYQTQRLRLCGR